MTQAPKKGSFAVLSRIVRFSPHSPVPRYLVEGGILLLLALATAIVNWKMIRDGINGMADLKWHIPWLQHFSKQLAEGIWYPRWLAGTNYGYGSPTFVFYAPLVYYIGSLLKFSGFNTENTIIALFSLAIFLSGLNCYYYRRFEAIAKEPSTIRIQTYYYPAWHLYLNQKSHPIAMANDGTMELKLEPGSHEVELRYQWTPAFIAGMILSFLSATALVFLWIKSSTIQIDNMRVE
ncbi:hypothetical protein NIES593_13955 [Hydrococcus rivularis NIES-593]|uniref:Uncharacterized protein n=1 Tax=Hydrococcus rivularis NIES-593 TaxID=1921803 RepID=A0A1U7HEP8_9CYAN|nr:hypothetical protein [Hydrococcus rivularis]OKH22034.1 hypothetical protein NIES593_13955 [Hydrococcus rivularis NIES-593]